MRRKRKQRFTWFPTAGSRFNDGEFTSQSNGIQIPFISAPLLAGSTDGNFVCPLTVDFTPEEGDNTNAGFSLRDIVEGQDWLLKRIVGKCFLAAGGATGEIAEVWTAVRVTAGIFVARADESDQSFPDLLEVEYNPAAQQNIMNPWVWRRQWMLGNANGGSDSIERFPTDNLVAPSVMDGPHIDSKVSRRIIKEHRLFFTLKVDGWSPDGRPSVTDENQPSVAGWLDVRILGAMRKGKNASSF